MSRFPLTSTSRALYRVFVAPNLAPRVQIPIQYVPAFQQAPFLPITSVRTLKGYGKKKTPPKRQLISDLYTFDNRIQAEQINLIDQDGSFIPNIHISDAMRKMNRVTHHLLLVSEGEVDEFGDQDPEKLPTCKIISKIDLRDKYNRKIELDRKADKPTPMKNLELNWAIAGGDLKHRLEKLKGFLRDGKKVEVLLGPKKRGRKATDAEAKSVLKAVVDAKDECRGAGEVKREGELGGVLTLVFQGQKLGDKQAGEQESPKEAEEGASESAPDTPRPDEAEGTR
ncbi:hypothetical protein BU23DRAFT_557928 [Bimuria novae-zelandiae CBS 107.79]|uniref:Translation initiation factor 3 N-terminal domain-containing protein n=1 Tax=Bimuria novae-zelandiae CBS 107.79 TaxID=1447943 RepID=A0A6A5UV74_9PLEO|nr:hypothetical protein BU23DRAFT_557928 [Bimuria novae-zelandiae CBS 107.79]